ncbi:MAG TPA: FAD-dependent oxidoreductase [Propionicimonas sp.]|uniref:FAD-dependent oxidoreductase n=1 Tax=Propionicimonas sp. TaxID=1955623 RepID=UPI002F422B6F
MRQLADGEAVAFAPGARPHRVVVLGNGMVSARFVDNLARLTTRARVEITVLGEESVPAYNRLLLAEVVGGTVDPASLTLPAAPGGVAVHLGRLAVSIDRVNRTVEDADGVRHRYDTLVLATGAAARVPTLASPDGWNGKLPVHTLRTLDDCRRLLRAGRGATRAVIMGGGLLGIEAASGLRARGIEVTVVHAGDHMLDRQLDPISGDVARRAMADLGIALITGATVRGLLLDGVGAVRGVELSDRSKLDADLVLVTAGVIPRVELARASGLAVDRGIVVGEDLRSPDDPRIAAIGDCAQPPSGCPGLLAPGWEQAEQLAAALASRLQGSSTQPATGTPPRPAKASPPAGDVVRLKADGLDIVRLGRMPDDDRSRVISLVDRHGRRSLRVAIEADRIVGAVLVGAGAVAAQLTIAFERGTPVPADPAVLLLGGASSWMTSREEDTDTVCNCNQVTRGDIITACAAGAHTVEEIACATRATTGCGGCIGAVKGLLARAAATGPVPALAAAAKP